MQHNINGDKCPGSEYVPSGEMLKALPLKAAIAFSTRCLDRILPLFAAAWRTPTGHHCYSVLVESTLALVTAYSSEDSDLSGMYQKVRSEIDASDIQMADAKKGNVEDVFTYIYMAAVCAFAIVIDKDKNAGANGPALTHIAVCDVIKDVVPYAKAMAFDYELIKEAAIKGGWSDQTTVQKDFFPPRNAENYWPAGKPKDWPNEDIAVACSTLIANWPQLIPLAQIFGQWKIVSR